MDREKIERAYKKFINENRSLIGNNGPLVAEAFEAAFFAVMSMPLSERLTDEEKERIINYYNPYCDEPDLYMQGARAGLSLAFGSDLFTE